MTQGPAALLNSNALGNPMSLDSRELTLNNIEHLTSLRMASIEEMGRSIVGKSGLDLLASLKRDRLDHGPYVGVSLFEGANRAMSDLVILRGVHWLLREQIFPFAAYTVEFGNEDRNGFDVRAHRSNTSLVGEAFNVASSFFQSKKCSALKKLRSKEAALADYRVMIFNHDAVRDRYRTKIGEDVYMISVDIVTGEARRLSSLA